MRELHADAMRASGPRIGVARSARDRATRQAAKRFTASHRDVGHTTASSNQCRTFVYQTVVDFSRFFVARVGGS